MYPSVDKELACVALRVQGIKPEGIAERMKLSHTSVYTCFPVSTARLD
jgi:hypothetical protein